MTAHIAVLRALGIGDLLTAVPALRALRRDFPDHRISLLGSPALWPLAELIGAVDEIVPQQGLEPIRWPFALPQICVNLHGPGPQSHERLGALVPLRLMAFHQPGLTRKAAPRWRQDEHEVQRWCRLLSGYDINPDPNDLDLTSGHRPSSHPGCVIVHPGAKDPARRWPARRFAAVAARLHDDGRDVVITGNFDESLLARSITSLAGLGINACLAGKLSLGELAALVRDAGLVLCGDTGIAHLATAYRTPSVVLFGHTSPHRWGPPNRAEHRVLWRPVQGETRADGCAWPSLRQLDVGTVLFAARNQLTQISPA